jgi:hypothetical protein
MKAQRLAGERADKLRYEVCELQDFHFREGHYDAAALIFFHLPPPLRSYLHSAVEDALRSGGRLILQAFHTSQLGLNSGGPKREDMLMDRRQLENDFKGLEILCMEERMVQLDEGPLHSGEARVINFVGIKN